MQDSNLYATAFQPLPSRPASTARAEAQTALSSLMSIVEGLEAENAGLRQEVVDLRRDQRVDRLTGIYNTLAMEEYVEASRYDGYYIFADGDGMGVLNKDPEVGHDRVNEYIAEFGAWLRSQTRYIRDGFDGEERRRTPACADAIAVRKHGDEFLVWASNKRGAMRIRNAIRTWSSADGRVTFSAGLGPDKATADMNCTDFKKRRKEKTA